MRLSWLKLVQPMAPGGQHNTSMMIVMMVRWYHVSLISDGTIMDGSIGEEYQLGNPIDVVHDEDLYEHRVTRHVHPHYRMRYH